MFDFEIDRIRPKDLVEEFGNSKKEKSSFLRELKDMVEEGN